jgi:hypothetical protein
MFAAEVDAVTKTHPRTGRWWGRQGREEGQIEARGFS